MTSGAFTAAYLELAAEFERRTGHRVITEATSMGVGRRRSGQARPWRGHRRGDHRGDALERLIAAATCAWDPCRSGPLGDCHGGASGAPKPDISTVDALTAHAAGGDVDCLFGQRQRHVSVDRAAAAAGHRRPGAAQEPADRHRARRRRRRPRRGRARFSAAERAVSDRRHRRRRAAAGGGAAGDHFAGGIGSAAAQS